MNGTLYARDSLPPDLAIHFGTSLGISPVCYLRENVLLAQHLAVLGRAADALGYSGFDPAAAADSITMIDTPQSMVALVPTPPEHKAAAPGADWVLVAEPFVPPAESEPLRVRVSPHRRNHLSPTINTLLLGDGELRAGRREAAATGHDDVVWLNLDDAVSCVGPGALFADVEGRVVTPPLADGVPDTAWRAAVIQERGAVEQRMHVGDLYQAVSAACLRPWGSVHDLESIDDVTYTGDSLAVRLDTVLAAAGRS